MKKFIGLAIALVLIVGIVVASRMKQRPTVPLVHATVQSPHVAPPPVSPPPTEPAPAPELVSSPKKAEVPPAPLPPQPAQSTNSPKEPVRDPSARVALAFVGMDPDAEAYWFEAINDPSLPPVERQNLIEDLNEDGLSDPKNPGPEDLQLILNRLALIEELGPFAMDKVNSDAFAEAYKDLLNLAKRTQGGGQPVK